jgi:hypothetical protein
MTCRDHGLSTSEMVCTVPTLTNHSQRSDRESTPWCPSRNKANSAYQTGTPRHIFSRKLLAKSSSHKSHRDRQSIRLTNLNVRTQETSKKAIWQLPKSYSLVTDSRGGKTGVAKCLKKTAKEYFF